MLDVFCLGKKFLVFNLVSRDLIIKYRRSFLGFFWTILHPLALVGIFYVVFKVILKISIPHYITFLLSGIIPWTFFSISIIEGTETLNGNSALLTKVPVPPQVFPLVACITNFVTFWLAQPILLGTAFFSGVQIQTSILLLPLLGLILFMMAHSLSLILSVAYIHLKDLKHAISLIMQIWFYATPVLYSPELIPSKYLHLVGWNPVGRLFVCFHKVFLGQYLILSDVLISILWALVFFVCRLVS